jgi:hypothetical protein
MEVERVISRNAVEIDEERPLFQVFFLRDNKNQSVEVEEVEEIDFGRVKVRLEQGESVFITTKCKEKVGSRLVKKDTAEEPWYLTRV